MRHLRLLPPQAATDTFGSLGPKTSLNELLLENGGATALAAAIIGLKLLDGAAAPEAVVWGLAAPIFVSTKVISRSVSVTRSPYIPRAQVSVGLVHAHHLADGHDMWQGLLNGKYESVGVGKEKGALGTAILAGLAYALHTGARVSQLLDPSGRPEPV